MLHFIRSISLFALLFTCFFSRAFSQVEFGLQAGYNDARFSGSPALNTFHAGLQSEIHLAKSWYLDPALLFYGAGAHVVYNVITPMGASGGAVDLHLSYLRVPANLLYKIGDKKGLQLFAGAGLYLAAGLTGREKGSITSTGYPNPLTGYTTITQPVDQNVHFGQPSPGNGKNIEDPAFKRFDLGYTLLLGAEWRHWRLTPSLEKGFIKVYNSPGYDVVNNVFSLSLAYLMPLRSW